MSICDNVTRFWLPEYVYNIYIYYVMAIYHCELLFANHEIYNKHINTLRHLIHGKIEVSKFQYI